MCESVENFNDTTMDNDQCLMMRYFLQNASESAQLSARMALGMDVPTFDQIYNDVKAAHKVCARIKSAVAVEYRYAMQQSKRATDEKLLLYARLNHYFHCNNVAVILSMLNLSDCEKFWSMLYEFVHGDHDKLVEKAVTECEQQFEKQQQQEKTSTPVPPTSLSAFVPLTEEEKRLLTMSDVEAQAYAKAKLKMSAPDDADVLVKKVRVAVTESVAAAPLYYETTAAILQEMQQ